MYLLLAHQKFMSKIGMSVQQVFQLTTLNLLGTCSLGELLNPRTQKNLVILACYTWKFSRTAMVSDQIRNLTTRFPGSLLQQEKSKVIFPDKAWGGHVRQGGVNFPAIEVEIGHAALGGICVSSTSLVWVLSSTMASTCM